MKRVLTIAAAVLLLAPACGRAQVTNSVQGMFLGRNLPPSASANFEYCSDGRIKAADRIEACKRLSISPSNLHSEQARFVLAALYKTEHRYDDALATLNALYEQYNSNAKYEVKAIVLMARGELYAMEGRFDDAVADEKVVTAIYPGEAKALNNSCWIRAVAGRELDAALVTCNQALGVKPNDPFELDSRGLVNLKLQHFEDALTDYNAALTAKPDLAASLYGRGVTKLRKGDLAGGQDDLAAAKKLRPDIAKQMENFGIKP